MQDRAGKHEIERSGFGHERADEHKPYEFGDPFHLNVEQTVKNAIWRQGSGTPVRLSSNVGPAVIGLRSMDVVLPEWILSLDESLRAIALLLIC